ncbi:uncharacterized protein SCHCODRAFT_02666067 [Schizophyllum commune H4-8]|uniref:Expressed protein n=1 Tax=Schizophyllum commune (strain H4-8 / FGSC 9210) TaxID=578458 RepID=D8Q2A5_SCHCM|nr:uncharacterized protein SCHCODRAFT_02666067 [Schizophyllum commune H4-8]KAI5895785.1 hypothetical protein SCHCODRAFT_02666067 [Schizophyllum commune H4-8]
MGTVLKRAGRRVPAMHPPPSQPLPALPNPNVLSSRPPLVTRTSSSHSASIPTLSVKGVQQSSASDHQLCSAGRTRDRSYSIASTASSCEPIHEDIKEN